MNLVLRGLAAAASFLLASSAVLAQSRQPPITDAATLNGTPAGGVLAPLSVLLSAQRVPANREWCAVGDSITNQELAFSAYAMSAGGGTAPYTIAVSGMPTGMSAATSTTGITFTAGTGLPGTYPIVVSLNDSTGSNATTLPYTLTYDIGGKFTLTPASGATGPLTISLSTLTVNEMSRGPAWWAMAGSNRRIVVPQDYTFAHPGDPTTAVLGRMGPILSAGCGGYLVLIDTNDLGALTLAQIEANDLAIYQQLLGTGKPVVAMTTLPRNLSSQAPRDEIWALNRWKKSLVIPGLYVVDTAQNYGNPLSTTAYPCLGSDTGQTSDYDCSYDGLHPKSLGAYRAFSPLGAFFTQLYTDRGREPVSVTDLYSGNNPTGNLIPSGYGLMAYGIGTAGTVSNKMSGTAPDGWAGYTADNGCSTCTYTGTVSQDALADGTPAAKIVFGGTAQGGYSTTIALKYTFTSFANFSAGDKLYAQCRVEMAAGSAHVTPPFLQMYWTAGGYNGVFGSGPVGSSNPNVADASPTSAYSATIGTAVRKDSYGALPAVPSLMQISIGVYLTNSASGPVAGTLKVGGCLLRKLV